MIDLPTLYNHQEDIRDRTRAALVEHGRVILAANPGFGKTRCAKWILGASANRTPEYDEAIKRTKQLLAIAKGWK